MKNRICLMMLTIWITMVLTVTATEAEKKNWDIPYLGRLYAPVELEIIDGKDVITEFIKMSETIEKSSPVKNQSQVTFSDKTIEEGLSSTQISFYQLAMKNNGTYNTAFLFAGRATEEWNKQGVDFFNKLKSMDSKQQVETHAFILKIMDELYTHKPECKNIFQLEILEFYPFEQFSNKNAQIISVGGSIALRTFKIVYPTAFKIYFIKKDSHFYILGEIDSGTNRKMWQSMTKEMLSTALWSWVY